MSKSKTKEELVRLAWIAALRRQGDRQCRYRFRDGDKVCAVGLLREMVPDGDRCITEILGCSLEQFSDVMIANDLG